MNMKFSTISTLTRRVMFQNYHIFKSW